MSWIAMDLCTVHICMIRSVVDIHTCNTNNNNNNTNTNTNTNKTNNTNTSHFPQESPCLRSDLSRKQL